MFRWLDNISEGTVSAILRDALNTEGRAGEGCFVPTGRQYAYDCTRYSRRLVVVRLPDHGNGNAHRNRMTTTTTDTESIGVLSGVDPVGRVTDSLPSRPFHTGRGHCCVSRYCGPPSAVRRRTLSRSGCSAVSARTLSRCSVSHELCCATTRRCGVAHLSSVNTVSPSRRSMTPLSRSWLFRQSRTPMPCLAVAVDPRPSVAEHRLAVPSGMNYAVRRQAVAVSPTCLP